MGYNNGEYDRTHHEEVASIGGITSKGTTFIKADKYISTGGILKTDHIALDVNKIDESGVYPKSWTNNLKTCFLFIKT